MGFLSDIFDFLKDIGVSDEDAQNEVDILRHNNASKGEATGHIRSKYGQKPPNY